MDTNIQVFNETEDERRLLEDLLESGISEDDVFGIPRRVFLKQVSAAGASLLLAQVLGNPVFAGSFEKPVEDSTTTSIENGVKVAFRVNGTPRSLTVDSRMTLLDSLRERLDLTGSKKGCDHGQCGACTVLVNGKRVLSCLTLAASCEGKLVTTIEGLARGTNLHPVQEAFIRHDGFQCGYCTPGQICSAVALLEEAKRGDASFVTQNLRNSGPAVRLTDKEISERMSGNICRCGAYANIVAAIRDVHTGKDIADNWQFIDQTHRQDADI